MPLKNTPLTCFGLVMSNATPPVTLAICCSAAKFPAVPNMSGTISTRLLGLYSARSWRISAAALMSPLALSIPAVMTSTALTYRGW